VAGGGQLQMVWVAHRLPHARLRSPSKPGRSSRLQVAWGHRHRLCALRCERCRHSGRSSTSRLCLRASASASAAKRTDSLGAQPGRSACASLCVRAHSCVRIRACAFVRAHSCVRIRACGWSPLALMARELVGRFCPFLLRSFRRSRPIS
jgi:hypothetical protein